jgi:hypothetical protein
MADSREQVSERLLLWVVGAPTASEAEIVELVWIAGQVVPFPLHVPDAVAPRGGADHRMANEHRPRQPDAGVDAGGVLAIRVRKVELDP